MSGRQSAAVEAALDDWRRMAGLGIPLPKLSDHAWEYGISVRSLQRARLKAGMNKLTPGRPKVEIDNGTE